jgi:hypothetical protein
MRLARWKLDHLEQEVLLVVVTEDLVEVSVVTVEAVTEDLADAIVTLTSL